MSTPCELVIYSRDGIVMYRIPGTYREENGLCIGDFEPDSKALASGTCGSAKVFFAGGSRDMDMLYSVPTITIERNPTGTVMYCQWVV